MRQKLVLDQQSQKAAELLRDVLDILRHGDRRRDGVERPGNAFELGEDGRVNRAWQRCLRADVSFGEIALGQSRKADAELGGLRA